MKEICNREGAKRKSLSQWEFLSKSRQNVQLCWTSTWMVSGHLPLCDFQVAVVYSITVRQYFGVGNRATAKKSPREQIGYWKLKLPGAQKLPCGIPWARSVCELTWSLRLESYYRHGHGNWKSPVSVVDGYLQAPFVLCVTSGRDFRIPVKTQPRFDERASVQDFGLRRGLLRGCNKGRYYCSLLWPRPKAVGR